MKNQKGVTLIALVITIIVLLILAGVSIAMLMSEDGILGNASSAKYETALGNLLEAANLASQDIIIAKYDGTLEDTAEMDAALVKDYIDAGAYAKNVTVSDTNLVINDGKQDEEATISVSYSAGKWAFAEVEPTAE